MAAQKFLTLVLGKIQEVLAVQVGGGGSANQLAALDATGRWDASMMPAGIGAESFTGPTTAAISLGQLVNIYSNAGVASIRPADNTVAGSEANGYATAGIASGASGTVNLGYGIVGGLSGLTIGAQYYLGTVGGIVLAAALPTATGAQVQNVGKALSATTLMFMPYQPVTLA